MRLLDEPVGVPTGTSEADDLPEGWAWTTLSAIAELKGGITKGQKRRPGEVVRAVPYLRVANVQRGYLDLAEIKTIEATETEIGELRLQSGDVLFNEGGDRDKLGRGWIWSGQLPECIHQNHVFRGRMRSSDIDPKYVSWYGNSEGQDYFFSEGKQTVNLASLSLTKLSTLPIRLPPAAEQRRIVAQVEALLARTSAAHDRLARVSAILKHFRQSVLAAAYSGQLTVDGSGDMIREADSAWPEDAWPDIPEDWKWAALGDLLEGIDAGANFRCIERPPGDRETGVVRSVQSPGGLSTNWRARPARRASRLIHELSFAQAIF